MVQAPCRHLKHMHDPRMIIHIFRAMGVVFVTQANPRWIATGAHSGGCGK